MGSDTHAFGTDRIRVAVKEDGAEPVSLQAAGGTEMLWQAGPEWPRHAPVLFPIVGRLKDDTLLHDGQRYRMTQHGFARDRRFTFTVREADGCRLVLEDDTDTRAMFPFAFRLEIVYRAHEAALSVDYILHNTGQVTLPASVGAHPAFRWPLKEGVPKEAHRLVFDEAEADTIRQVEAGLLQPEPVPSPIRHKVLALDEHLFANDAVILSPVASRSVRLEAPGAPSLTVSWHGMTQLGIWSKPGGAPFLCIEPWRGLASPAEFDGPFLEKPHLMHLAPGESQRVGWRVELGAEA